LLSTKKQTEAVYKITYYYIVVKTVVCLNSQYTKKKKKNSRQKNCPDELLLPVRF